MLLVFFLQCFISSYCCSFLSVAASSSLQPLALLRYVTLVVVSHRNRSCAMPPVTLRSQAAMNVYACYTLSSLPAQQRPHRIYVLCYKSCFDPGDFIINFTLNMTSNANSRDNIVVTISTRTDCKCCYSFVCKFPFLFVYQHFANANPHKKRI